MASRMVQGKPKKMGFLGLARYKGCGEGRQHALSSKQGLERKGNITAEKHDKELKSLGRIKEKTRQRKDENNDGK